MHPRDWYLSIDIERRRDVIELYYSGKACFYHYLHMAQGNFREYLQGDQVWLKKYFYVLRPVLALKWLEKENSPAPMKFEIMVDRFISTGTLKQDIKKLLKNKRTGNELQEGPRIDSISEFLEQELSRLADKRPAKEPKTNIGLINPDYSPSPEYSGWTRRC